MPQIRTELVTPVPTGEDEKKEFSKNKNSKNVQRQGFAGGHPPNC